MKRTIYIVCTIALLCAILVMPTASAEDVIVWEYTGSTEPWSAERLPNGNTLIADGGTSKVIEVAPDGTIVWEYLCTCAIGPNDANRLSNGNTLITEFDDGSFMGRVIEVAPDGTIVWEYSGLFNYLDADRLPNGNTLIADFLSRAIEVAPDGTTVWEYTYPNEEQSVTEVDRLSNGNTLITTMMGGIIEVTPDGTIVWEYSGSGGWKGDADRLSNGNTLISDFLSNRVIEVTPDGTIVWEYSTGGEPTTVERLSNGNTLIVDSNLKIVIEVDTPTAEWNLVLNGEISDVINQTSFEEGVACHNVSWTDDNGRTWTGIPLWKLVGWVDDDEKHSFNDNLADAGYDITVIAGDECSKTFGSSFVKENDNIFVANELNGTAIPEDDSSYPLRLTGSDLSMGDNVKNVVEIRLTFPPPPDPWEGYLLPQDSTGSYGEDTQVELWVTYNETGLTYGALAHQFDLYFDPECVNVTDADFSTSPFGSHMFTPYAPGVVRIQEDNYNTMTPIASGTYKIVTFTLHGESAEDCNCDLWFDPAWCAVSDTDGNAIANSSTNGTYTCVAPQIEVVINEFCSYSTSGDWIELYNKGTSEILLDGWSINDSDSEIQAFGESDSIPAGSYLVVDVGGRLNRDGDTITLLKGSETIDEVTYGSGAVAPGEGNSTGRYPDGVDTDNDAADFIEFGTPTSGETNEISIPEVVTISIGTVIGNITAPICIDNALNIGSADITITYDSSVCVITEVTGGSFDYTFANMEQNDTGLVRIGAFQTENPGLDGSIILANLRFRSTSASGTSDLGPGVNELTDATLECNDIPYVVVNGIYITFLNGDVSGDGEVTLSDTMYLAKHVLGVQGFEEIGEDAADVNGDGEITLSDAMCLAKHVLGIPGFEELR